MKKKIYYKLTDLLDELEDAAYSRQEWKILIAREKIENLLREEIDE